MKRNLLTHEIARKIEDDILNGKYQTTLPRQQELADKYHVSRVTLGKALDLLVNKGMIAKVTGHPATIREDYFKRYLTLDSVEYHFGLKSKIGNLISIKSHIISFSKRKPTDEECQKLQIAPNDFVYDIIRQRLIQDESFRLEYTVMPVTVIPGLTEKVLNNSIYSFIENDLHLKIGKANRVISADTPDAYDKKYLNCTQNEPILKVEQVVFLENGIPFEFSESRARYDKETIIANNV